MGDSKIGTKRLNLRFAGNSHLLRYKTEFEEGEAVIVNVSTGGCALGKTTVHLSPKEKILIILQLEEELDPLEISARVIRVEKDYTAVRFLLNSDNSKLRLVKYFARKQRSTS